MHVQLSGRDCICRKSVNTGQPMDQSNFFSLIRCHRTHRQHDVPEKKTNFWPNVTAKVRAHRIPRWCLPPPYLMSIPVSVFVLFSSPGRLSCGRIITTSQLLGGQITCDGRSFIPSIEQRFKGTVNRYTTSLLNLA